MAIRLSTRLSAARHLHFVGREAEIALFRARLAAGEPDFQVLWVFGPGGVGKSSLLRELAECCQAAGVPSMTLDGRSVEATPESLLQALRQTLALPVEDSPVDALGATSERRVLLIDTFEMLAPLDRWLRDTFLPELPEHILVVLAGREPPSPAWRADAGWQGLLQMVPLRNLSPGEGRLYLEGRGVPVARHNEVLGFTHGHPLALSLVADSLAQRPDARFEPESVPDVLRTLLQQFIQQVPGPVHRAALEACGLVRLTTEALLAELVGVPDAHDLFEWLRGLSIIESGPLGLHPHDLAREVLAADVRWRNPDWYAALHERARRFYLAHLQGASPREQQRVLFDYIFLHRDNPVVRPFFEFAGGQPEEPAPSAAVSAESARPEELPVLVAMAREHEGEEAAHLVEHWTGLQPAGAIACRDDDGKCVGMLVIVALDSATPEQIARDPATAAVTAYLARQAPLRPGERAALFRFWMARDTYQTPSPTQSLIFVQMVRHYLTTPGLAFTFLPCSQPDLWAPMLTYADLSRLPETDFAVGSKRYGVYGHDWRATPPVAWLELLARRETGGDIEMPGSAAAPGPLIVLSEPEFSSAIQDALRHLLDPAALRASPLLRSRLVVERAGPTSGETERITALQALTRESIDSLRDSPRDNKLYRALYHSYVQPAPTQEQAAELLDLPFSTFRRHLKAGVIRIIAQLWQREVGWLHAS